MPGTDSSSIHNAVTIDVEDWFHILELHDAPDRPSWGSLPSRVEANFHTLLDLLDEADVRATCFFLGWIAERFPGLVRAADRAGHEVASHGYGHQLIYTQTQQAFAEDIARAKKVTEDILGKPVLGYRAPGFSIVEQTPWAMATLAEHGFAYDSSIFPASRSHGGIRTAKLEPHMVPTAAGEIFEFPLTVALVSGTRMCFFGGGYFRLFPYWLIERMGNAVRASGRGVVYYIHPREIDPSHPRLPMNTVRRFKSYVNLAGTRDKLRRLLAEHSFVTLSDWLASARAGEALSRAHR